MQGSHFHLPIYGILVKRFSRKLKGDYPSANATLSKELGDYREHPPMNQFCTSRQNEGQG